MSSSWGLGGDGGWGGGDGYQPCGDGLCVCRVSEGSEMLLQVLCLEGQVACLQRAFGTADRGAEWRRLAEW